MNFEMRILFFYYELLITDSVRGSSCTFYRFRRDKGRCDRLSWEHGTVPV